MSPTGSSEQQISLPVNDDLHHDRAEPLLTRSGQCHPVSGGVSSVCHPWTGPTALRNRSKPVHAPWSVWRPTR